MATVEISSARGVPTGAKPAPPPPEGEEGGATPARPFVGGQVRSWFRAQSASLPLHSVYPSSLVQRRYRRSGVATWAVHKKAATEAILGP